MATLDGSLADLAAALRAKEYSARELVEAALERHERFGARLQAYKLFDADRALADARAADDILASTQDPPPLTGIPVSVKDLYGVDGLPTFAGTPRPLPKEWSRDAWLVARLREAGAITVGKTHMVEMAFGGVGLNPHWGTPWNPWDAETHRTPGGSSSGAGVSLWEGSALVALGSDTGGSIRIPAAFTGTVGPRTTQGRWPTDGVVPLSHTFDTVGALTRTVEDSIYFFGTVDPEWGDPVALAERLRTIELDDVRIAIPRSDIWEDCQVDIGDVVDAALGELKAAGAGLAETEGGLLDDAFQFSMGVRPIVATECRAFLEEKLPGWLEILHPIVASRLENAPSPDDPRYADAIVEQRDLAKQSAELFDDADVLALPGNIITPPVVEELDDLERYGLANSAILRPTYPISVLGLCAISIPAGLDEEGMPVGLQLVGQRGEDERLLGIARAAERVLGTARERLGTPPLLARG